ncbi:MAG: hypothetical protein U1F43_07270 [Myxococcota bacterium]
MRPIHLPTPTLGLAAATALALLFAPAATAATPPVQTIAFDETMTLDALGDATFSIGFSLTASQYANWHQKYGENKSLIKRDVGKVVSQFDTYDWDVQVKEMDRRVEVAVKAHGAVKHLGNGVYELEVPKSWKGGARDGQTIGYNYVESLGIGLIGQYNVKVVLPPSAGDIVDATGESGERVLRYHAPVPGGGPNVVLLAVGAGVLALGLALTLLGLRRRASSPAVTPPARLPPPPLRPPAHPPAHPVRPIAGPPPRQPTPHA